MDPTTLDINGIIVNVILSLVGLAITGVGGFLMAFIKSKLNTNQLGLFEDVVTHVVLAVEQNTYGSELANDANAKKSMAMTAAASLLDKYGVHVTGAQLDTAIESAVANVLNSGKLIDPPITEQTVTTTVDNTIADPGEEV